MEGAVTSIGEYQCDCKLIIPISQRLHYPQARLSRTNIGRSDISGLKIDIRVRKIVVRGPFINSEP